MTKEQERLRELYSMMAGIPDELVDLSRWKCGTLACAGGWACQYPPFMVQGLTLYESGPSFDGDEDYCALANFFGISYESAFSLFGACGTRSMLTDRRIFLIRLRNFLVDDGIITKARSDELARNEEAGVLA